MPSLKDRTVLVIGRGSGIARAITLAVGEAGGRVVAAGRHPGDLAAAYHGLDVGTAEDVAAAALAALTNGFLTGVSLPVDSGEHLV
jgi:NAD(P)-dependent dehydrogenase (short-subunit alcohol dehydrogenase family)